VIRTAWGPLILLGAAAIIAGWSLLKPRHRDDRERG
jgi:hypothetical protein